MAAANAGRKATLVVVSNLAGAGLGYLALLLIGRYFDPSAYGSYLFALSAAGLLAMLTNLGVGTAHQRHVAQGLDPGAALGVLARLRLAAGLALAALAACAWLLWAALRGAPLTDATTPAVLGLAALVQALSAVRQALFDTWQGQQRVHRVEALRLLDTAASLALLGNAALLLAHLQGRWEVVPGVGAFWAGRLGLEATPGVATAALLLACCYAIPKALTLAAALLWAFKDRLRLGPWDAALARSYLRFALPVALTGALALLLQSTDTMMVGYFWASREVGLYGAAQKLSALCLLGAAAVGAVLFPRFAQLHAAGDARGEEATFRKAERYLLLLVTPAAAAMAALPAQGLHIAVGDDYLGAAAPLRLLALWALLATLQQPIGTRLTAAGHVRRMMWAAALNAAGNFLLNLWFIPSGGIGLGLGPTGAALGTLLSTLASYAYLRAYARRSHGIPVADLQQLRILAAGAAAAAFWVAALRWAGPAAFDRFWELGAWGLAGGLLYLALLAALRGIGRHDFDFLRKVAHPGQLLAEMRGK